MNPSQDISATNGAGPASHPVVTLRDQLTQTTAVASRLRSILATVEDDTGRRFGEQR